jgi:hypothetical protein
MDGVTSLPIGNAVQLELLLLPLQILSSLPVITHRLLAALDLGAVFNTIDHQLLNHQPENFFWDRWLGSRMAIALFVGTLFPRFHWQFVF